MSGSTRGRLCPDAIFFDYGDTLVQDTTDRYGDIRRYLLGRGIDLGRAGYERGWAAAEAYAGAYRAAHGDRTRKEDRFWYTFCRTFLAGAVGPQAEPLAEDMHAVQFFTNEVYPDTISTLEELRRRGYRLGIISNWEAPTLPHLCDRFGLSPFFDLILPSCEAEASKPNPHIFHVALAALAVAPDHAIHIGDSFGSDIVGARRVGITPVWLSPDDARAPDSEPLLRIHTRRDVLDLVE